MPEHVVSDAEVEALKANWRSDPCWDIEETEGFEARKAELLAYRLQVEAEWEAKQARLIEATAMSYGIADNLKLAAIILHLEQRIRDHERRISELEGD